MPWYSFINIVKDTSSVPFKTLKTPGSFHRWAGLGIALNTLLSSSVCLLEATLYIDGDELFQHESAFTCDLAAICALKLHFFQFKETVGDACSEIGHKVVFYGRIRSEAFAQGGYCRGNV